MSTVADHWQRRPRRSRASELRDIVLAHLESIYAFYGEDSGLRIARKHLGWYSELLEDLRLARLVSRRAAALHGSGLHVCAVCVREGCGWVDAW
jgi:tRNA-dihydrouridine synthase